MPEELSEQLEPLYEIIKATRIPIIQCPGFEADDIIGTLAKQADQEGLNTFIVSGGGPGGKTYEGPRCKNLVSYCRHVPCNKHYGPLCPCKSTNCSNVQIKIKFPFFTFNKTRHAVGKYYF